MKKKRILKNQLALICMCLTVLCTAMFAGALEVRAEENWEAFRVKLATSNSVKAGESVTFNVSITNTTNKDIKLSWINPLYYRDANNSEKYPGEAFGTLKDSKGKVIVSANVDVSGSVSIPSKKTQTYKLTGKIPKTWNKKSEILVVVTSIRGGNTYFGQGEFLGKDSSKPATAALKGTALSSVKPAKKKAVVKWKKQTKGTTGYQIQYSLKKNFKGAKVKTINGNKKTSLTIKSLKSKKTYYVRIRTYKKASGGNQYSSWSTAKKVKIK